MPVKYVSATGKPTLESLADILTVNEAALGAGVSSKVIRKAIKEKKLRAFTPGGDGTASDKGGRGLGYRIKKAELARWFLGEPIPEKETDAAPS